MAELSPLEAARFARQIMLDDVGLSGQRALVSGTARVAGDALAELYVARAGVGNLAPRGVDEDVPVAIVREPAAQATLASARAALAEIRRILAEDEP